MRPLVFVVPTPAIPSASPCSRLPSPSPTRSWHAAGAGSSRGRQLGTERFAAARRRRHSLGNFLSFLPEWVFSRHYFGPEHGDDLAAMIAARPFAVGRWAELGETLLPALDPVTRDYLDEVVTAVDWSRYDAYFQRLARLGLLGKMRPWLPFEGSRGCWYGQKAQCTFCGLHEIMEFRAWDAHPVLEELERLAARYGIGRFYAVDLILPRDYLSTLLPELARRGSCGKVNPKRSHRPGDPHPDSGAGGELSVVLRR